MREFIKNTTNEIGRKAIASRCLRLLLLSLMLMGSLPAHAEYTFQVIIPPEADFAQTFGINNAGKVVGGTIEFSFVYDMKKGEYTDISSEMAVLEISNSGVMVGRVDDDCAIRDKKGNITLLYPPSLPANYVCSGRGVNQDGKVSGFVFDGDTGDWFGFIYDPEYETYEEFLPSPQTIAHAINAQGQNVGNVTLVADEAYPGSPAGRYGYRRQVDGSVKYFAINQSFPGQTRGRGISENGLVTGFYLDSDTGEFKSFVTILSDDNEFEQVTLTDDQILYQKPCNPDVPDSPGPGYELYSDVTASQIRNDGVVVGSCTDYYFNDLTVDLVSYSIGFIATPE